MWICCHHGTALCFWSTKRCSISLLCNQSTETLVGHLQRFRRSFHSCSGLSYIRRALLQNLRCLLVSSSTPLRSFFFKGLSDFGSYSSRQTILHASFSMISTGLSGVSGAFLLYIAIAISSLVRIPISSASLYASSS